ncbi:MAG: EAL domain-containing protein, partial [Gammaproteobacteria bacterium]|nr:EAL domain-containing protein [Gammaproteobacteria bacterium]
EIKSYYQPKVEMTSCNIISLEALARWHHPKLGWIPPDEFIPLAEEHGLIGKLTSLMLDLALTACEELIFKGFSLNVAVNISAKSLGGLNFPDEINKKVQEHNLDTSKVVLEITESAITEDIANALDVMTRIRMKGIHLSIDDFGTGYSSIEMLHRYPFDELKVDRSFVSQMMTDHDASAIVETSIEISKKMNMKAVAEGVESKEIWAALRAMGCDEAQGDFICKAIPKESIPEWVSNWKKKTADLKLRLM